MLQISRACAAIDILDNYIIGTPIEKALKEWFKNNRFAGSNDRRSIRDIIFDILRKRLILFYPCLLYTSPSPRDDISSRMPSSA